jgi:hypothetical protein
MEEKRIKCVSCGNYFTEKKERKSIKVTLSNPGDVLCEGNISTCLHCQEQYVDGDDMFELAKSFDDAHSEKYSKHKKVLTA